LPERHARLAPAIPAAVRVPFRFIGRMEVDGQRALVFFGRGRSVTLRAPGHLDAEYVVEAIFEDRVLLRHLPTSTGQFLELKTSQVVSLPPPPPESYPPD
jgi:hypothetical protein